MVARCSVSSDPSARQTRLVPTRWSWLVCLFWCGLGLNSGCGQAKQEDPETVVPLRGKVVYKGQAVSGAQLSFHRQAIGDASPGESGFAISDPKGEFVAMTNDNPGLFPGEYRVTVTHPQAALPKKYSDAEDSPLELTVFEDEPSQKFEVNLQD